MKVTKDNLDDAGDWEDVPDPYEALNDDVLVVGENDVAGLPSKSRLFHVETVRLTLLLHVIWHCILQ